MTKDYYYYPRYPDHTLHARHAPLSDHGGSELLLGLAFHLDTTAPREAGGPGVECLGSRIVGARKRYRVRSGRRRIAPVGVYCRDR